MDRVQHAGKSCCVLKLWGFSKLDIEHVEIPICNHWFWKRKAVTQICEVLFLSRLKLCLLNGEDMNVIPLWIKSKCWCQRFYSDKSRDVDPFLEKVLYRIASTKLLFKMAISIKLLAPSHSLNVLFWPRGGSWPSIISQTPTLIHCHLAWMLQLLLPSWCQAPSNL